MSGRNGIVFPTLTPAEAIDEQREELAHNFEVVQCLSDPEVRAKWTALLTSGGTEGDHARQILAHVEELESEY